MEGKNNAHRFTRMIGLYAALLLIGISSATVVATAQYQESNGVDRPTPQKLFIGQTPYTQEQGTVMMNLSGLHDRMGDSRNSSVTGSIEYGVTDNLQIQAEVPIDIADRTSNFSAVNGVSRASVGAKYSIIPETAPLELAVGGDIEMPLGTSNAMNVAGMRPQNGPLFKPSLSAAVGQGPLVGELSAQAEFGAPTKAINYTVGGMYDLGSWTPTLELNARAAEQSHPTFYATPGVYYNFSDRASLGVGAAIGLGQPVQDTKFLAGFHFHIQ